MTGRQTVVVALAVLGSGMAAPAREAQTRLPGFIGDGIVVIGSNALLDAESAWVQITAIVEATPPLHVLPPMPGVTTPDYRGYVFWQEVSNRLLRELGWHFFRQFPDDPRCWRWLEATRRREPLYLDVAAGWKAQTGDALPAMDEAARQEWSEVRLPLFRAALLADDNAPDDLRIEFWLMQLGEPLHREMMARLNREPFDPAQIDLKAIGQELVQLGHKFPAAENPALRNLVGEYFRFAARHRPADLEALVKVLEANPNRMLSDIALGQNTLAQAKEEPVELVFTAIDGREVDLARLRGKVVLIDFRGVTWCGACRNEEPYMKAAYAKYREHGFEIITITYEMKEDSRDFVLNYTKENGLVWPHYFDGQGARNPHIIRFGVTSVPRHFLLDQAGLLVATDVRGPKLEAELKRLLGL